MSLIKSGNLNNEVLKNPQTRGWFVGHFIGDSFGIKSDELEIKWGAHKKGETFDKIRANKNGKSLSILISGKAKISFPDEKKEVILSNQGDFVFWEAGIFHTSKIIEDSVFLTIRWPSIPNDVIIKQDKN